MLMLSYFSSSSYIGPDLLDFNLLKKIANFFQDVAIGSKNIKRFKYFSIFTYNLQQNFN
jgi:hypothetical protein